MYEAYDPRSKLAAPSAGAAAAPAGFAAAEYVKFHDLPPAEHAALARTWYGRGQNMVVSYSECEPGAQFARTGQMDEYMLVLPEAGEGAVIEAGAERVEVPGFQLAIIPPGDSRVTMRQKGLLIRVISTRNADVAALSSNAGGVQPPASQYPAVQAVARAAGRLPHPALQSGRAGKAWPVRAHLPLHDDDDQHAALRARSARHCQALAASSRRFRAVFAGDKGRVHAPHPLAMGSQPAVLAQ